MNEPILSARGLVQDFSARGAGWWRRGTVRAIDVVDLDVREGEALAIVGESGSGKSSLARLLLALARPTAGTIAYRGTLISALSRAQRRTYRRDVQAVFQDPAASLNPRMRVEQILSYVVLEHGLATRDTVRRTMEAQLEAVGLSPAASFLSRFPHQLSGGQQQRIAIARALSLRPRLIIADEPLSSLDITVQTQLLELIAELRLRSGIGFVLISHDLGAVESIADRVAVMYRGRIVEQGAHILSHPQHPYTRALLDAKLIPDPRLARARAHETCGEAIACHLVQTN
ncbi:MAG TPA: ATP-binding cassette domain-containing protein [Acetobacteraceae bacterium]|jgi:ABC-type oligopeptide transport system ATPase subunit|nr:ATP-binding cassette domain-containing protein [Acetobacteraceae bacterium]